MTPLGREQLGVLKSLRDHGRWSRGCGWIWSTHGKTERILDSLVKRGLVIKSTEEVPRSRLFAAYTRTVYSLKPEDENAKTD